MILLIEFKRYATFHNGPAGYQPHCADVLGGLGRLAACGIAADGQRTLGQAIDLAVHALPGCLQKHATCQRRGIAHGGDRDIKSCSGLGRNRHARRNHDRSHILDLQCRRFDTNAHLIEHVLHGTERKDRVLLIACTRQSDHKPITDELIVTHTRKTGYILNAHSPGLHGQTQCYDDQTQKNAG